MAEKKRKHLKLLKKPFVIVSKLMIPIFSFLTRLKVRTRLIIFFLIISIIPITIVGYFAYTSSFSTIEEKVGFYTQELVKQATFNINNKLGELEKSTTLIISNMDLMKILSKREYSSNFEQLQDMTKVKKQLSYIEITNNDISNIIIYRPGEEVITSKNNIMIGSSTENSSFFDEDFSKSQTYMKVIEEQGRPIWVTGLNNSFKNIFLMRKLTNAYNGKELGVLIYQLENSLLNNVFENVDLGQNASISILNQDRMTIFNSDAGQLGVEMKETYIDKLFDKDKSYGYFSDDILLHAYDTCKNEWKIIAGIPYSSLMGEIYLIGKNTLLVGLLCIIFAVLISLLISISISSPLYQVSNLMARVEAGDLTVTCSTKGKDEIASLSNSFNIMIGKIRKLINDTTQVSELVEKNSSIINEVAVQTASSAQQVSSSVETISEGALNQAQEAQESVNIMNKLSEGITNVNKNIQYVVSIITGIKKTSKDATNIVELLNQRSQETTVVSSQIQCDIDRLNDKAQEISKIINVIEEISEQTNLLSLNASIEAARAGEAGKGFSVVAEEVRRLAEQSGKATNMIKKIVEEIFSETQNTVIEVKKANNIYKGQELSVEKTIQAFKEISNSIENIINGIDKVNTAINDINEFKKIATEEIESMASIAQESAAATEEVTAVSEEQVSSAEQLSNLSEELRNTVNQLKITLKQFKI